MSSYTPNFFGLDRKIIDQAMRKARRERAEAIHSMLRGIFPSVADEREADAANAEVNIGSAKVAHL